MPRERVEEPGTGAIGSSRTQETTHVQIFARDDFPLVILVRVAMYQCKTRGLAGTPTKAQVDGN